MTFINNTNFTEIYEELRRITKNGMLSFEKNNNLLFFVRKEFSVIMDTNRYKNRRETLYLIKLFEELLGKKYMIK